jgi:hypothetical protein
VPYVIEHANRINLGGCTYYIHQPGNLKVQDLQTLQRNLGSLFVTTAFMDEFNDGLTNCIAMTISTVLGTPPSADMFTADAAHPMASVLWAAQDICSNSHVTDDTSLEIMLEAIGRQSDVADECNEADRALALADLERCFEMASEAAWGALREVQAGFLVSSGDFVAWKRARMART